METARRIPRVLVSHIYKAVEQYVKTCHECQSRATPTNVTLPIQFQHKRLSSTKFISTL